MHAPLTRQPFNGALIFNSPDEFFAALFGPRQHDEHVKRYRVWLKDWAASLEIPFWERARLRAAIRTEMTKEDA